MTLLDSHKVNHNFFTIPDKTSAYVAGFIAADGCIVKDRIIQVAVNVKDETHLRGLLTAMDGTANVSYGLDNTVKFSFPSTQMAEDLKKHYNITPRKSLTLEPPNIKKKSLIKSFISGFIDGDGCFRYGAQSKHGNWKYLCLEVVSTRPFLEWMDANLPETGRVRDDGEYARLAYTCKKAFEVYNYLHDPTLPLLERKWDNRYKIYAPRREANVRQLYQVA